MDDIVDSAHEPRNCPYCGRRQFWFSDDEGPYAGAHYVHYDDCLRYCDEERLARWDLAQSLKKTDR